MANKIGKIYGFFATKICFFFFAKKVFWCTPCNWGAWAHFRRTQYSWALSERSSARSRRAMAVAPMFFQGDERSEGPYCLRLVFFFAKTWHPSAFVKVSAILLQTYFSETIQNFKKRSASECPFWPCKKVPKIFRLGDYISFENMIFAKIFRVFSDFA